MLAVERKGVEVMRIKRVGLRDAIIDGNQVLSVEVEATFEKKALSEEGGAGDDPVDAVVIVQFDKSGTIRVDRVAEFVGWGIAGPRSVYVPPLVRESERAEEGGDDVGLETYDRFFNHPPFSDDAHPATPDPAMLPSPTAVSRFKGSFPRW